MEKAKSYVACVQERKLASLPSILCLSVSLHAEEADKRKAAEWLWRQRAPVDREREAALLRDLNDVPSVRMRQISRT